LYTQDDRHKAQIASALIGPGDKEDIPSIEDDDARVPFPSTQPSVNDQKRSGNSKEQREQDEFAKYKAW
jgi:hypothetical protein